MAETPVGIEPEGVIIAPDGKQVIVTSEATHSLHFISIPEHKVLATLEVGGRPRAAAFTQDSQFAFSTSELTAEIKKIDMQKHEVVKTFSLSSIEKAKPKDIVFSKDQKTLYVALGRASAVAVIDVETLSLKTTIAVGERVWGLALSKDGSRLYSTNGGNDTVSIIDTANNTVLAHVNTGKAPWGVVIDD